MAIKYSYDAATLTKIAQFVNEDHIVKIGVLASSEKRTDGVDAVDLASIHEFGSYKNHIPKRSFLVTTMAAYQDNFKKDIESSKDTIFQRIKSGQGMEFLQKMGAKWVAAVHATFKADGYGWKPLSARTIAARSQTRATGNKKRVRWAILRDTGALLRSITHEVVK